MNTCSHDIDSSYELCERCLQRIADGDAVLGRFDLIGPGAGLAVDLSGGRVTVYMVQADTVIYGDGGAADAWVTFDDQLTGKPDFEVHPPIDGTGDASTRDLANTCEVVSEVATSLLPILEEALDSGASADEIVEAFRDTLLESDLTPTARRVFWNAMGVLVAALLAYRDRDGDEEAGS